MKCSGILSTGKILIADVFGENSCVHEPRLDFDDLRIWDKLPGELLIESLWRKEADLSFIEAGYPQRPRRP